MARDRHKLRGGRVGVHPELAATRSRREPGELRIPPASHNARRASRTRSASAMPNMWLSETRQHCLPLLVRHHIADPRGSLAARWRRRSRWRAATSSGSDVAKAGEIARRRTAVTQNTAVPADTVADRPVDHPRPVTTAKAVITGRKPPAVVLKVSAQRNRGSALATRAALAGRRNAGLRRRGCPTPGPFQLQARGGDGRASASPPAR
jgi:hypothetical protein